MARSHEKEEDDNPMVDTSVLDCTLTLKIFVHADLHNMPKQIAEPLASHGMHMAIRYLLRKPEASYAYRKQVVGFYGSNYWYAACEYRPRKERIQLL